MSSRWPLLLWLGLAPAAFAQAPPESRWALVVGENRGLSDEDVLRYAQDDAKKVLSTLEAVGGVPKAHAVELLGADADQLRAAFQQLSQRLAQEAGPNDLLFVYVSSHAGDGELHLDGTRLKLTELTDFIRQAKVGVGVLVLDACRSGAVTRVKGLKPLPTQVQVEAGDLEGRVFISASGADEYAQESDELKGSYFTHHWVTGLRGAADTSRDGKVTLEEAYQWAYARTLESTFGTQGGIQRPAFKVDLHGRGELVLTDPSSAKARLTLASEAPGRWLIVSAATGAVVADLQKRPGALDLAVPPGPYRVRLRTEDGYFERSVTVADGGAAVRIEDFEGAPFVRVAAKGAPGTELWLSAGVSLASPVVPNTGLGVGAAVRFARDAPLLGPLDVLSLGVAFRDVRPLTAVPFGQQELELRAALGHRFERGRLSLVVGLELGAIAVFQSSVPLSGNRFGLEPTALVTAEGRVRISGPWHAFAILEGGGAAVHLDAGQTVVPRGLGALGLGLSL